MPSVEAGVCNVALLRIGQLQTLDSLDDPTPHGKACKRLWDNARDTTLEAFSWPFAKRRATLALLTDGERGAFDYAYTLPSDCIAPRFIETGNPNPGEGEEIPFEVEGDAATGRVLLTNEEDVVLVYTAQVNEPVRWSPMFRNALAYMLASDLAFALAKKPAQAQLMMSYFAQAIRGAAASSFNQRKADVPPESTLITSRG